MVLNPNLGLIRLVGLYRVSLLHLWSSINRTSDDFYELLASVLFSPQGKLVNQNQVTESGSTKTSLCHDYVLLTGATRFGRAIPDQGFVAGRSAVGTGCAARQAIGCSSAGWS